MSDPLERLGELGPAPSSPDPHAVRDRARGIRRRRRAALGVMGGTTVAVLVAVTVLVAPGDTPGSSQLAEAEGTAEAFRGAPADGSAGTTAESSQGEHEGEAQDEGAPSRSKATVSAPEGIAADASGPGSAQGPSVLEVTVEAPDRPVGPGERATFVLRVCNPTSEDAVATFSDGQRYDFEVRRGDRLVWRWSDGRVFPQVLGSQRWGPDECRTWSAEWSGNDGSGNPQGPGTYEVTGVLTSDPPQRSQPRSFCHVTCDP